MAWITLNFLKINVLPKKTLKYLRAGFRQDYFLKILINSL